MKFTKTQKDLFNSMTRDIVIATLIQALVNQGEEVTEEVVLGIQERSGLFELESLSQAFGEKMAELVDLKQLAKVTKYLNQPETTQVITSVQAVTGALREEIGQVINDFVATLQPEEAV